MTFYDPNASLKKAFGTTPPSDKQYKIDQQTDKVVPNTKIKKLKKPINKFRIQPRIDILGRKIHYKQKKKIQSDSIQV